MRYNSLSWNIYVRRQHANWDKKRVFIIGQDSFTRIHVAKGSSSFSQLLYCIFALFMFTTTFVRFAYAPCDFISLYLILLTFAMRLKSVTCKSHWNILVFYDQWKFEGKLSYLNMSNGKMSDFVSIPLSWFTLVIKLRNCYSESHANTFW